jgi:hypothetical protein
MLEYIHEDYKELFDELAGIYEYDAHMSREDAEFRAYGEIVMMLKKREV